jgi:hypothetical protein
MSAGRGVSVGQAANASRLSLTQRFTFVYRQLLWPDPDPRRKAEIGHLAEQIPRR